MPNKHLRQKSQRVAIITEQVRKVIDDMKAATLDWEAGRPHELGVALAAVQIDQLYKIVVIRNNFEYKKDKSFSVLINPEVTKLEGEVEEDYEGCLSVVDIYGKVPRHTKVRIRALDEMGRPIRVKAEGFLARILQHEIDHTSGIMFVDHIEDKVDAFYKINSEGKLVSIAYEEVKKANIFR